MPTNSGPKRESVIVVFNEKTTKEQIQECVDDIEKKGGEITNRYDGIINGFSASVPSDGLESFKSLKGDLISYIEPDQTVTIQHNY